MLHRSLFFPIAAWALATSCLAEEPVRALKMADNTAASAASNPALATFQRLDAYIQNNPLDFNTTFNATSDGNELYRGTGHFLIRRPNQLRAEMTLGHNTYVVISDGTVMTIANPQQKQYSQTAAPPSISAAFGFFTGEIGIDSQVLNFMGVVDSVVSGSDAVKVSAAGSEDIGGRQCDKFTVSGESGDDTWIAWLEKKDTPLLCRLIYRSVDGPAQTNDFRWNASPTFTADTFVFTPTPGSAKVDIGTLDLAAPE
jgi:hypothetical protein